MQCSCYTSGARSLDNTRKRSEQRRRGGAQDPTGLGSFGVRTFEGSPSKRSASGQARDANMTRTSLEFLAHILASLRHSCFEPLVHGELHRSLAAQHQCRHRPVIQRQRSLLSDDCSYSIYIFKTISQSARHLEPHDLVERSTRSNRNTDRHVIAAKKQATQTDLRRMDDARQASKHDASPFPLWKLLQRHLVRERINEIDGQQKRTGHAITKETTSWIKSYWWGSPVYKQYCEHAYEYAATSPLTPPTSTHEEKTRHTYQPGVRADATASFGVLDLQLHPRLDHPDRVGR